MRVKQDFAESVWSDIEAEMRHILIGLARGRKTICYSDLAAQIQTAYVHHRAPAFMRILRNLAAEDLNAGCPNLAVLVVRKHTGRCGPGFFKQAAAHGADVSDPEVFWQAEFERVCKYWAE